MNRAQRRQAARAAAQHAAHASVLRSGGRLVGLPGACADCNGLGDLTPLRPDFVLGEIWHDPGCPAANGVTDWRPAS